MVSSRVRPAVLSTLLIVLSLGLISDAIAQIEPPDRRFLFLEDYNRRREQVARKREIQQKRTRAQKRAESQGLPLDMSATQLDYDSQNKTVKGSGGVILSYSSAIIEAESGSVSTESKEASLLGDIRITDPSFALSADEAQFNIDKQTGTFENFDISFEEGDYRLFAKEAEKLEGQTYELKDTVMSTCSCPEGGSCLPWEIRADEGKITREGYGQAWGVTLRACNVPVFYLPYLVFPAKTERQTGVLPPRFGGGRRGFELRIPFFWNIDRATDATFQPLIETNTRVGTQFEFRKIFSQNNQLEMGGAFLNESFRDGDLQGTVTTGLSDPTLKENRFAGYLNHYATTDWGGSRNTQFITELKHVNDDLLLREFQLPQIDDFNARFVTSRTAARTGLWGTHSLEAAAEFNQAMVDNDDLLFQRLPELSLLGFRSFKPFGQNPLGARLVLSDDLSFTNFSRKELYDGRRFEVFEKARLPFAYKNIFEAELSADVRATQYQLDDERTSTVVRGTNQLLPSTSDRIVPGFGGNIGTAFEKVFPVEGGNPLKFLAELGQAGRSGELMRVKHVIEPSLRYRFVPQVDQSENPQFDLRDRLSRRNVVTWQIMQRFFGKYEERNEYLYGLEEATPEVQDIDPLMTNRPIDSAFGYMESVGARMGEFRPARSGSRREFANFRVYQSFDFVEDRNFTQNDCVGAIDPVTGRCGGFEEEYNPFSDLGTDLTLLPNEYVRFQGRTTWNPDSASPTSYSLATQLLDKRGDQIRARMTFLDPRDPNNSSETIRQIETTAEARITDRMKLAFYGRYDDVAGKFLENRMGVRFKSSCNCWILDVDIQNRLNPDETRFGTTLTLVGLGAFGNSFFMGQQTQQSQ